MYRDVVTPVATVANTIAMPPALSLPTTHAPRFPDRNLTLASSVADAAPPPSLAVAAARVVTEQIEAHRKLRRVLFSLPAG